MLHYYYMLGTQWASKKKLITDTHFSVYGDCDDPSLQEPIAKDVIFRVKKGTKWSDLIVQYEGETVVFFSQRFVDLLSTKMDMQNYCYPIKIEGNDVPESDYYCLYKLPTYELLNDFYADYSEPPLFLLNKESAPKGVFSLKNTAYQIVDQDTMLEMKKMKFSNIEFCHTFGVTMDEYEIIKQHDYNHCGINSFISLVENLGLKIDNK